MPASCLPVRRGIKRWAVAGALAAGALILSGQAAAEVSYRILLPDGLPRPAARNLEQAMGDALDYLLQDTKGADPAEEQRLRRRARDILLELLATEGYFNAQVAIAPERRSDADVAWSVAAEPGVQSTVRQVQLRFVGTLGEDPARQAQLQSVRAAWPLGQGVAFRQAAWEEAKRVLVERLARREFASAELIDSRAEVDPETNTVDLTVEVDSGPAYALGPLEITGLKKYEATLVERYNNLHVGEPYDRDRLLALQTALQNTPYFSAVLVDVDTAGADPRQVPVRVQVTEARSKRVGLAVGLSTDSGPHLEASYRQSPILGGPNILQTGLRIDRLRTLAYADVLLPPKPKDYRDSVGVLAESSDIQGLRSDRVAIGATRARTRGNIDTQLSFKLQREERRIANAPSEKANVATATYTWTQRKVDSLIDPRRGHTWTVQLGAGTRVGSDTTPFTRAYARYQHYHAFSAANVAILRGELGTVATRDRSAVPTDFLFRAGGTQSVRGYAYQGLGIEENGATVGARQLAIGSAEIVHWFNDKHGAAAFYDAGLLADRFNEGRWAQGIGAGYRLKTVAGPLAFDLAYGARDKRARLHFSIAIAF
jgi:translocation and assembly module TamA